MSTDGKRKKNYESFELRKRKIFNSEGEKYWREREKKREERRKETEYRKRLIEKEMAKYIDGRKEGKEILEENKDL